MTIRTRFAPSPTGFLHVGGIRTALFAYLVAHQADGQFVLRLEDTDKNREVEGSGDHIIRSLSALGISHDEGPDIGGPYAPYKQSDRLDTYKQWANKLIEQGRAYADPYTPAEIQAFRDEAVSKKQAFRYRDHRPENPPEWDGTMPLRFKAEPKSYTYHDEVMGDITTSPEVVDDFILIKSDGYPTYNFAHIVDDSEMHITHVIRGQEFISSMPNFLALYEALGFDMTPAQHTAKAVLQGAEQDDEFTSAPQRRGGPLLPKFAHMPHIMNEQGNKKLGKRDGAKDVLDYIRDGYLPEALVSFIATLGWNDGTEQEVFTMDELLKTFSLARVQRSGARFDEKRLLWMNGHFIRELSLDELYARVSGSGTSFSEDSAFPAGARQDHLTLAPSGSEEKDGDRTAPKNTHSYWPLSAQTADEAYRKHVLALAQDRLKTLADLPTLTSYFFEEPTPDPTLITGNKQLKKLAPDEQRELLGATKDAFTTLDDWTSESIQDCLNTLLETTGQKPGVLFSLIRIATTWAPFSPQLNDTLALLGQQKSLSRITQTIEIL